MNINMARPRYGSLRNVSRSIPVCKFLSHPHTSSIGITNKQCDQMQELKVIQFAPMLPKKQPKHFLHKECFLNPKKLPNIQAKFEREYLSNTFQKQPNLVTLLTSILPPEYVYKLRGISYDDLAKIKGIFKNKFLFGREGKYLWHIY